MHLNPSLEEAFFALNSYIKSFIDPLHKASNAEEPVPTLPSAVSSIQNRVQDHLALITPPPELRLRDALPEPQANCQQADQSASQAIQQASQQASQSIQQASQQASQSIQQASQQASQAAQQASQSASQAIQQFSNQASQSIAAASRSVSSAVSSASSAIASAQSSADQAISRANVSMQNAMASASSAQSQASQAVVQAGAAVAAATGSAAAAGSSFLAAASKATQSAQVSEAAISAAAASQVSQASQQATASQTAAVTATQAALAIVGSIIASTLITILVYFLVIRHKRTARRRSRRQRSSPKGESFAEPKFPVSAQNGTTIAASQSNRSTTENGPMSGSPSSFTQVESTGEKPVVKTTTVVWNPSKPPKAPTLNSWLKVHQTISPFGPINLPTDTKSRAPLGGQLKSPLRSMDTPKMDTPKSPRMTSGLPGPTQNPVGYPSRSSKFPVFVDNKPTIASVPRSPLTLPMDAKEQDKLPRHASPGPQYRESKASVWTDEIPYQSPSPPLHSPPKEKGSRTRPASRIDDYGMTIPSPRGPVRNTAEWFASCEDVKADDRDSTASGVVATANIGVGMKPLQIIELPRKSRMDSSLRKDSTLWKPGQRSVRSVEGDVRGLGRFLEAGHGVSLLSRDGSKRSDKTPGVGRAL